MGDGRQEISARSPAGAAAPVPHPEGARAEVHLRRLHEISTWLCRIDELGSTLSSILDVVARVFELRSAVFILESRSHPTTLVWQASGERAERLAEALRHAQATYRCFSDLPVDLSREGRWARPLPPLATPDRGAPATFLALPLVVDHQPIFGALQLEGAQRLDERDLVFANAIANQLAVALAHRASIEAREADLRAKLDFVHDVAASLGEGLLAIDLEGRIILCNQAAERLLEVDAAGVIERPITSVLEIRGIDGAVVDPADSPLTIAIRGGTVRDDARFFATATRPPFPVSYTASPVRQGSRIAGAVLVFRDLIAVKRLAIEQRILGDVSAAVASSLDQTETLAAVVSAAVPAFADLCFVDELLEGGQVRRAHAATAGATNRRRFADRLGSFAPGPGSQSPQRRVLDTGEPVLLRELTPLDDIAHDSGLLELLREAGVTSMIAVPLGLRDERFGVLTFAMAESGRRFGDADLALAEQLAHRTAIAIDNDRLYAAAQRAIRARENLLAVVSHDLRSPLSVVLLNAELLRDSATDGLSRKRLDTVTRATERMGRLIQDLLVSATMEAGRFVVDPRPIDVAPIVAEVVDELAAMAERAAISVGSVVPPGLPAVLGDAVRIHQVLANLVSNAIKFTTTGGHVRVEAGLADPDVRISVVDDGPGLAGHEIPQLFDRFWQAPRTARQGTGLGLFIVKGIVEAHGGRVRVESAPGVGSTFHVYLPRA